MRVDPVFTIGTSLNWTGLLAPDGTATTAPSRLPWRTSARSPTRSQPFVDELSARKPLIVPGPVR
ncbi:hypothetical protein [Streptomyces sp. DSS69]|uniref:hypothetical protein n=1 Tax=unclassified Streptomyces TaxID=2593676 RepID=UPI0031F85A4B